MARKIEAAVMWQPGVDDGSALEVREDLLNHNQIFDACDDLDVAAAALADFDIEHTLQALCSRRS